MSQNPNDPNYNPYGPNPTNPNYPGSPGTAYGGPQPPPGPNSGYNTPYPAANPPSGPNPNTPNSSYGQNPYNPYAPPPPPGPGTGPNPYTNPPVSNPYDPYAPTAMSQQASSPSYPNPASSPGYTSYPQPGMMGTVPPPMAPMGAPQKRGNGTTILISVIALIVVIGGIVFGAIAYNNNQTATKNNHLTATAQTGNANATATSQVQATASAVANTYPFSTKLLVSDPMVDNSKGMNWEVNQQNGCFFSGSSYHVFDDEAHSFGTCASLNKDLTDYTFEASMVITQASGDGDGGGLIFRADEQNVKLYRVTVDQNGVYRILIYVDEKGTTSRILKEDTVPSFNTGLQQTNVLSVVVRGDQISFYVNRQLVTTVTDSTYTHGQIGFDVTNHQSGKTEVAFTNVKVWDLS